VQYRDLKPRNADQFRQAGKQVIVDPSSLKSGDYVPFDRARS
jgi:hypothetical protein